MEAFDGDGVILARQLTPEILMRRVFDTPTGLVLADNGDEDVVMTEASLRVWAGNGF